MKRHSEEEITTKLRQAKQLMAGGQSQAQVCKGLGVSVMTCHRWRKRHPAKERRQLASPGDAADQEQKLRIENGQLRRIATDLLLEKVKAEEQIALSPNSKSLQTRPDWRISRR